MTKILYVVSTLKQCGPTNQLSYIIKYLDKSKYTPVILTLSPEPSEDSMMIYFINTLGVQVESLALSRLKGFFFAKRALKKFIQINSVDLIHSQGLRPDSLLSKVQPTKPWLLTSRNYPFDDYPMKFGKIKGWVMAMSHIKVMKICKNVIACSKTIESALRAHNINVTAIQNGVSLERKLKPVILDTSKLVSPVFITVGSLIPRKNMEFIINAFNSFSKNKAGTLLVLGDGPELSILKSMIDQSNTFFEGNVENVKGYLESADYFISASLSEGLPNTVLEALATGLPSLLSDISSHREIARECRLSCHIFNLNDGELTLAKKMENVHEIFPPEANREATHVANSVFSAEAMSSSYQKVYQALCE